MSWIPIKNNAHKYLTRYTEVILTVKDDNNPVIESQEYTRTGYYVATHDVWVNDDDQLIEGLILAWMPMLEPYLEEEQK